MDLSQELSVESVSSVGSVVKSKFHVTQDTTSPTIFTLPHGARLLFLVGDITRESCDAIVNAANSSLLGGGGVDGAIHRAGGPQILDECKAIRARIRSLPAGEAVATTAGHMPSKRVVHTVGPVWYGGDRNEPATLANAWRNSLRVAHSEGLLPLPSLPSPPAPLAIQPTKPLPSPYAPSPKVCRSSRPSPKSVSSSSTRGPISITSVPPRNFSDRPPEFNHEVFISQTIRRNPSHPSNP